MLKHLYLIFIATFVFGFIAGVILFLYNNTGQEVDNAHNGANVEAFTIHAYMYGGCMRGGGCASYQISHDGSYTYIVKMQASGERKFSDILNKNERDDLREQVGITEFENIANTQFIETCPVAVDGVAYRYDILYNDERYEFDSCVEDIENEVLFKTLREYFDIFSAQHNN